MKTNVFLSLFFILLNAFSITESFASDRVRAALIQDNYFALEELQDKKAELQDHKDTLNNIEKHLKTTEKGNAVYYNFQKIGGSLLLIGIVVGSYKASFPPGLRAMVAGYVTVNGASKGMVKLSSAEVIQLLEKVKTLRDSINKKEAGLKSQMAFYCAQENYHSACN